MQTQDASGVVATLTLTTDYTVSGVGAYAGGSITLTAGNLTAGVVLLLLRSPVQTQEVSLQTQGAYSPTAVEGALDDLTMQAQAATTGIERAIRGPLTDDPTISMLLPSATLRALGAVTFDALGNVTVSTAVLGTTPVTAFGATLVAAADAAAAVGILGTTTIIANLTALRALTGGALAGNVYLTGRSTTDDGGQGVFAFSGASSAADNGGTIIAPTVGSGRWIRLYSGPINVYWFGAKGDGITDDTAAIAATITAAPAGSSIFFPVGTYLVTGLTVSKRLTLYGEGFGSVLLASGAASTILTVTGASASGGAIHDLQFQGTKTDETTGAQRGIYVLSSATNVSISRCLFGGSSGSTGLNVQIHIKADRATISDNYFIQCKGTNSGFGYGVLVETSLRVHVVNNVSEQATTQGRHHVYLSAGSSGCVVEGNTCSSGTSTQITVFALDTQDWCESNVIQGNVCIDSNSAVVLGAAIDITQKCRHNIIDSNVVRGAVTTNGIMIQGGNGVSDSRAPFNVVRGNIVAENGLNGILLVGCDDALVEGNHVYENSASSSGSYVGLKVTPGSSHTPTVRNRLLANAFLGTSNQRGPWSVNTANGVVPSGTFISGNRSPKGSTQLAQDDGDDTEFDEVFEHRRSLSYSDFSAASTTHQVVLFALGPGEKVESVTIKHSAAFTGTAISAYTVSVGIATGATKYAAAFNVLQAPSGTAFQDTNTQGFEDMGSTDTNLIAQATSTGANLSVASTGQVNIWVRVRRFALPAP